ncbi:MAG: 50S ribosomal protein L5 [Planctomycetota bacterium]|nr:MAG: 50S ribosomal protein L5 [Planctomycetota bacterium]
MSRLLEKYKAEIVSKMMETFGYGNRHAVPRLDKIVVNMGVGRATENSKRIGAAMKDLATITGQKPVVTKARHAVSGFRIREGVPIGVKVTLRQKRMYEFLDRLISITIPRIRDFRGLPTNSFDGHGNYSLGLSDQFVFPEINVDKVEFPQGMDITLVIENSTDDRSLELLRFFGMPFRRR